MVEVRLAEQQPLTIPIPPFAAEQASNIDIYGWMSTAGSRQWPFSCCGN